MAPLTASLTYQEICYGEMYEEDCQAALVPRHQPVLHQLTQGEAVGRQTYYVGIFNYFNYLIN